MEKCSVLVAPIDLSIGAIMLLIAGAAFGLWLVLEKLRAVAESPGKGRAERIPWFLGFVYVLGGLALVGVPLLLVTARRRPWGLGEFSGSRAGPRLGCSGRRWCTKDCVRESGTRDRHDQWSLFFVRHSAHGAT